MSSLAFHMDKIKMGGASGLQRHNQRENKNYSNQQVDLNKSHLNYDLVNKNNISYVKKVEQRIEEGYKSSRKIRDNTVKLTESIISSDKQFFEDMTTADVKKFFQVATDYFKDKFGADNVIYAHVHLDETTPHMHIGMIPLTDDGRLSAKELINRNSLKQMHTELVKELKVAGFDIERGRDTKSIEVEHLDVKSFKIEKVEEIKAFKLASKKKIDELKEKLQDEIKALEPDTDVLVAQMKKGFTGYKSSEVDALMDKFKALEREIAIIKYDNSQLRDYSKDSARAKEYFKKENDELRSDVATLKAEISKLKDSKELLKEMVVEIEPDKNKVNQVLNNVMKRREERRNKEKLIKKSRESRGLER